MAGYGLGWSVREFGAVGDGVADDTVAVQAAIDACAAGGGGTVVVPAGRFLVGTVQLRSRLTLHLEAGAVLVGSTRREAYRFVDAPPGCALKAQRIGLVTAFGAEDVAVTGRGRIAGQGHAFWTPIPSEELGEGWNTIPPRFRAQDWRPMMVLFEACRNVLVEGVVFDDAPAYAGWLIDCDHVAVRGVTVLNEFYGPNTDGFHFCSCRAVRVEGCHFTTGDDALAVDGNGVGASDGMTISGCTFHTSVNALRVYTGLDPGMTPEDSARAVVRNVAMSNCAVTDAAGVVNITAENGLIENIVVSNLTVTQEQEGTVFYLMNMRGRIRGVRFSQVVARCNGAATILGSTGLPLEAIRLEEIDFWVTPKRKWHGAEMPDPVPAYGHAHFAPWSVFARHVRDMVVRNVTFHWVESDLSDHGAPLKCRHVEGLEVTGWRSGPESEKPDLVDTPRVVLRDCDFGGDG